MLSVQTNLGANTALKNLSTNTLNMNNSMNKLSSGFRISSAADDAAGFAVSSKLDSQSMRLKAASLNATQAQAMVKMADAGVNEIQNMVNRIQTLATQASSTNNAGELGKLDAERIKLETQINKIANSTNFNGVNLLNGKDSASAAINGTVIAVPSTNLTANTGNLGNSTVKLSGTSLVGTDGQAAKFTFTSTGGTAGTLTANIDVVVGSTGATITAGTALTAANSGITATVTAATSASIALVAGDSASVSYLAGAGGTSRSAGQSNYTSAQVFQVGVDNTANNQVTVNLKNAYTTTALGLGTGDISTQATAKAYMDTSKAALNTLISQRSDLGATQNQLGFVQANLATSIEQTTASVSAIRDTDMAAQMADFTKNKILSQIGTSMLAQANQASQNVMSLFR